MQLPIPPTLRVRGYNHVGDIDVVGKYVYAPLEQSNFEKGEQVTARYDVKTLKLVDSVTLAQHENSFVTVDPKTMTAYSMDRFGGDALLRYDVRNGVGAVASAADEPVRRQGPGRRRRARRGLAVDLQRYALVNRAVEL